MAAQTSPLTLPIAGKDRAFGLLTVEDLMKLTALLPASVVDRDIIEVARLYQWASNAMGCVHVLFMSAKKFDTGLTFPDVAKWGSIMRRIEIARAVFNASVFNGEEEEASADEGKAKGDATGGSTPVTSPDTSPA